MEVQYGVNDVCCFCVEIHPECGGVDASHASVPSGVGWITFVGAGNDRSIFVNWHDDAQVRVAGAVDVFGVRVEVPAARDPKHLGHAVLSHHHRKKREETNTKNGAQTIRKRLHFKRRRAIL